MSIGVLQTYCITTLLLICVGLPTVHSSFADNPASSTESQSRSATDAELERLAIQIEDLFNQNQYTAATQLFAQYLQIIERKYGRKSYEFVVTHLKIARYCEAQKDYVNARYYLLRGLEIHDQYSSLPSQEVEYALVHLLQIYQIQNDITSLIPIMLRLLRLQEAKLGPAHPDLVPTLFMLGAYRHAQGDLDQALSDYRRALSIVEKNHQIDKLILANLYNGLGILYAEKKDKVQGKVFLERAIPIFEENPEKQPTHLVRLLKILADIYSSESDFKVALSYYKRADTIAQNYLNANDPVALNVREQLALLYLSRLDYANAELLLQNVLMVREKLHGEEDPILVDTLNTLALSMILRGDLAYAESYLQRARKIEINKLPADHKSVSDTFSTLAMIESINGNDELAVKYHEQSLEIRKKLFGPDHPEVTPSLAALAKYYVKRADYNRAMQHCEQVLAIKQKHSEVTNSELALAQLDLAKLCIILGQYDRAEGYLKSATPILEKFFGSDSEFAANLLFVEASLYSSRADYSRAESTYKRAFSILEKVGHSARPSYIDDFLSLAHTYRELGEYSKAERILMHLLDSAQKLTGANQRLAGLVLNGLAGLYMAKGDLAGAIYYYQRTLTFAETFYGTTHPNTAVVLDNMAMAYTEAHEYAKALPLQDRALHIFETSFGLQNEHVAIALNNMGLTYRGLNNLTSAEPLFIRAVNIREAIFGQNHPFVAITLDNLSSVYAQRNDYAAAIQTQKNALAILERSLGPTHRDTGKTLDNLAMSYWANGDIESAIAYGDRARSVEETNLKLIIATGSERQKLAYLNAISGTSFLPISLHLNSARTNPEAAKLALTTILQRKGRVLDAIATNMAQVRARLAPDDLTIFNDLITVRTQLAALVFHGIGSTSIETYRTQLAALRWQEEQLEIKLGIANTEFAAKTKPITMTDVRQTIPSGAALVEIMIYRSFNPKTLALGKLLNSLHYAAYVMHPNGDIHATDLGEVTTIDSLIGEFREALSDPRATKVKRIARALDEQIMRPIRKMLGDANTVLISPDGNLNLVPYATLCDENGHYLLERYNFVYLTSGRDLLHTVSVTPRDGPIAFANPAYGMGKTYPDSSDPAAADSRRSRDYQGTFNQLPKTTAEADDLKTLFPNLTVFTDDGATESALKDLKGPQLLHIATHGFFLPDEPLDEETQFGNQTGAINQPLRVLRGENPLLRSGLAFAGANRLRGSGNDDGILTALEAAQLDLRGTQLVVLSACQSGVGGVLNGEGVYGLRRALVIAGSESQVISLWKVADNETRNLIFDYYKCLKQGEGRAESLRQAQLTMLHASKTQHPYFWGAFIAVGRWTELSK